MDRRFSRATNPTPAQSSATAELAIAGMSCAACVRRVERALGAVPGVARAEVNFATERARVMGGQTAALIEAVRAAGYGAEPVAAARPQGADHEALAVAVACGLMALFVPGMLRQAWMLPPWLQAGIASVVVFGFGWRFFRGALGALRHGAAGMDLLVALGTGAAWGLSVAQWAGGGGRLFFDSAVVIVAAVRLGKYIERRARRRSAGALRALLALRPATIRLRRDGIESLVPLDTARVGDTAIVLPGERIAADGLVTDGEGSVDESLLSGETLPVAKVRGARLTGGAINQDGRLVFELTAVGEETTLARIVRLVESAQAAKPAVQVTVDRIAAFFVPVVVACAVVTLAGWWLAGAPLGRAVAIAASVLVIACPCAMGLATPIALMVGLGAAARAGILIKDADALAPAERLHTIVFDKTGTLTLGRPALDRVALLGDTDAPTARRWAAALSNGSEHSLARPLRDPAVAPAEAFRTYPGRGVGGSVAGVRLLFGNLALLAAQGVPPPPDVASPGTVSWLARLDPQPGLVAAFTFSDPLRPGARDAVARLRGMGFEIALFSGDAEATVRRVGTLLGIDRARGGMLPEDKARAVADLRRAGPVAMVGDGINDAPALAEADLAIAMGGGTDVALQTAGIALMRDDPGLVADAIDIARRLRRTIRQGLFWAFAYNAIGLPLAAAGLLTPGMAGAAMAASSVCVVANAMRLRRGARF